MSLIRGDLLLVLPTLEADSIDACVTDPPYELGFMGKHWDGSGVTNNVETWHQVYRVLKPGAHLLAFGGTRTYHRMTCAIEDAGFEIRDCLSWLYGSGFPKSFDVSKAMDAAAGAERVTWRVSRNGGPGGKSDHIGQISADRESGIGIASAPSTDLAKQWQGWGTALKPAWEPIILARKPLRGTVAANVAQYGTGAINVDACRIESSESWTRPPQGGSILQQRASSFLPVATASNDLGRWPANVLLDEEAAAMLDEQTGEFRSGGQTLKQGGANPWGEGYGLKGMDRQGFHPGDFGGASRFFYVAKPSREERDYGCNHLPQKSGGEATDRTDGSAGVNSPRAGSGRTGGSRNIHPTVKPVELMRYLVKLVTPPNGIVLDPFMGSGTTGMACRYESRQFIGIEREAEYVAIAEARIAAVAPLFGEETA